MASTSGAPKPSSPVKKWIQLTIKLAVTIACFYYISHKIDFSGALSALMGADAAWLLAAFLLFVLSKWISAIRLNLYFQNIGLFLSRAINIRLYLLGMFYNLFLPGAISGDAYKVVLLHRRYGTSYKKGSAAVLLDRISGVLALGLILTGYGFIVLSEPLLQGGLILGALLAAFLLYFAIRRFFSEFLPSFWPALLWGIAVQLCQVIAIYCLMGAMNVPLSQHAWVFIFLSAAVITILPLSLGGGLGTREFVFLEGARLFGLDPKTGIGISILFYLITVAGSVPGLIYVFRDPIGDADTN